jgi:hypothetical protein
MPVSSEPYHKLKVPQHVVDMIRIIYRPATRLGIEIVTIGPRKSIYRETFRLVKKGQRDGFKSR